MHISVIFQLIIKRLVFHPLCGAYQQSASAHPLQKQTQLPSLTHLTTTTLSHSFSFTITPTPPSPSPFPDHLNLSPSTNPQHNSTLSSPFHILQTTHTTYNRCQFFTNISLSTQTTYIPHPNLHPKAPIRPPIILQAMHVHPG